MKNKITQESRVLQYIKDFGCITTFDAFTDLGVTRLSDRIFTLRKKGYNIITNNKKVKNRYGTNVNIAVYTLEENGDKNETK